ncbi:hypothetical protein [Pseudoalteromonas sp. SR43-3]|uniref:hypothetical protein n=1 Tax=Pseudoalteromonas sp. SR43-3 TaxID=2760943 RepID=UPI0015FF8200|nr:hypothetical protein [Pseudoalteromonas sp. SR43-3]MBB1276325.1 hypothetical protein [Pseudoalteromonas sp. SR43-3]
MRLLIFLLALISAFFASADAPRLPDLTDLKSPNVAEEFCSSTVQINGFGGAGCSAISAFDSNRLACEDLAEKSFKPDFGNNVNYYYECVFNTNAYAYKLHENYQTYSAVAGGYVQKEGSRYTVQFSPQPKAYTFTCPPEGYPAHVVPVYKADEPTDLSIPPFDCAKVPSNFDNDCPPATENDPFTFSFRAGTHTVCYNVESGRQCEIETDENGGYYFPASFGAREPDECTGESDGEPTDPTEPTDPIDPTEPTEPDKTEEPEDKPIPEELDTEVKTEVIDGVNTTNINLDAINKNQISASNSNDERLNRIASEIQISNNYLSDIANGGSGSSGGNVDNQALAEIAANTKRTADNTEPLDFGISAGRKDKGLSTVFVNSRINELKEEIEEKNLEFENYLAQIQDESETLFTFDPNISADYEERLQVIKGVEVDLGVSRFSNFFKLIAPAILLAASITALFILLGGNKE